MSSDLVVALTGASGSQYGVRLVDVLLRAGRTVHIAISPAAVEVNQAADQFGLRDNLNLILLLAPSVAA